MPPRKRSRAEHAKLPSNKRQKITTTPRPRPPNTTPQNPRPPLQFLTPPTTPFDIYVFGSGESGELGLGTLKRNNKKPTNVQRPRLNDFLDAETLGVVQMDVGGMHCIALTHENEILTWGVNDNGALGRGTYWEGRERDIDVDGEGSEEEDGDDVGLNPKECMPGVVPRSSFDIAEGVLFVKVVATDSASFVLTSVGTVYGWGTFRSPDGEIGLTKLTMMAGQKRRATPILIKELSNVKNIVGGGNHVLALTRTGNVYSWGAGEQGQLGRPILDHYRLNALIPSQFGLPKGKIEDIWTGIYHSFALDERGRVFAWGLNNFGQTGVEDGAGEGNAVVKKPTVVKNLVGKGVVGMQGGLHHSIACTRDGECLVWGRCDDSQMGITMENLDKKALRFDDRGKPRILVKPTVVSGINTASVAAGIDNSFAITKDGEVYSWGFSASYRTGQGTEQSIQIPTKVENSALRGKKITFAGCGGQFSVLAGPHV